MTWPCIDVSFSYQTMHSDYYSVCAQNIQNLFAGESWKALSLEVAGYMFVALGFVLRNACNQISSTNTA